MFETSCLGGVTVTGVSEYLSFIPWQILTNTLGPAKTYKMGLS